MVAASSQPDGLPSPPARPLQTAANCRPRIGMLSACVKFTPAAVKCGLARRRGMGEGSASGVP